MVGTAGARIAFVLSAAPLQHSLIQETNVWKKAGIVMVTSLAAALALAPIAVRSRRRRARIADTKA